MLPAEIIDFTFSLLQNDRATLKLCAAAHPFLSSFAERYLFIHIIVYLGRHTTPTDGYLVPQLASCLSEKPHLAKRVRSITIDAASTFYYSIDSPIFENLSTLLRSMTQSERLSLRSLRWPNFPTNFRLALLHFLQMAHMKTFDLQYIIEFPLTLLDDLKNIKNLKVDSSGCSFKDISAQCPTSFESLSLVNVPLHDYANWGGPRFNNLVTLRVKPLTFGDLSPIFTVCSGSLRSLTLEIGSEFQTTYRRGARSSLVGPLNGFPFSLSPLKALEIITIHGDISAVRFIDRFDERNSSKSCVSAVLAITQLAATARPCLKRAVLNFDCLIGAVLDLRDVVEWGALVQLCDLPINLQVDLCIRASTSVRVESSFVEVVDSLMGNEGVSKLVERGSVVIKPFLSGEAQ